MNESRYIPPNENDYGKDDGSLFLNILLALVLTAIAGWTRLFD